MLSRAVFALARTKRRRFLWCAWWSGEPQADPFRSPDAWGGGARSREEAQAMAEKAAGRSLFPVDDHWAGAWKRVLAGLEPFPKQTIRRKGAGGINPFEVLGLTSDATADEVKRAFRQKALLHHPDRGGAADDFMATKRAYDSLRKR